MGKKATSKSQEKEDQVGQEQDKPEEKKDTPIECGIVMPISEIDGCSTDHWEQVREVIEEALDCESIKTRLVSDADEVGIIHKRIVQNLYKNPIVVCDVSGKNPNVMFELGLRLAFDKPTVVIKDDKTAYSFDTSPIEHLPYPRSLNYRDIVKFKKILKEKVLSTLAESEKDPNYSTFLGSYQITEVAELKTKEVTPLEYYSGELDEIKRMVRHLMTSQSNEIRNSGKRYLKPESSKSSYAITDPDDSLYQAVDYIAKKFYRPGDILDWDEMKSMLFEKFPEILEWYTANQIRDTISVAMARYMS